MTVFKITTMKAPLMLFSESEYKQMKLLFYMRYRYLMTLAFYFKDCVV